MKKTSKFYFSSIIINFNFNLKVFILFHNSSFSLFNISFIKNIDLRKLYNFSGFLVAFIYFQI